MTNSASVKVQVTVEVHVGCWDQKATFESLRGQVAREGRQKIETYLQQNRDCIVKEVTAVSVALAVDVKGGAA